MSFLGAAPVTFRPTGVSDAPDGSGAFPGAMAALQNLIPYGGQASLLQPRPANVQVSNFSGFSSPGTPNTLFVQGDLVWGFVPSARFTGKDEPFCYNLATGTFVAIDNVTAANTPTSPPTSGDWTPPVIAATSNARLGIAHPGYDGVTNFLGWIDVSGASFSGTGNTTSGSPTISPLSSNPLTSGWNVGMRVTGPGIPANSFIVRATATSITISNNATATAAGVALTIAGGTAAAPLYGAGNLNGNPLAGVATCVARFSARAWWAWKNYVIYSDTENPTQVTNASQALSIGDSTPITALAGLPLTTQVSGGVLQSLIVFKGASTLVQITGDAATNDLATNTINGSVGTYAPRSIAATPEGLAYIAPDGLRVLGLSAVATPPRGVFGDGVSLPFINALYPSRICAAYNTLVYRVTVQNPLLAGSPFQEWWHHWQTGKWTGPHTSPSDAIVPYFGTAVGPFVMSMHAVTGKLFTGYSTTPPNPTYTENGTALQWSWATPLSPDNNSAAMSNLCPQSLLTVQLPSGEAISILATNESGGIIDQASLQGPDASASIWGSFNWGSGVWGYSFSPLQQVAINWSKPEVFKQARIQLNGQAMAGLLLGDLHLEIQTLGYQIT